MGGDVGGDALDHHLAEGPHHPPPGLLAVLAPSDDLGHQVVVQLADGVAFRIRRRRRGRRSHPGSDSRVIVPGDGRNRPPAGSSALIRHSMACPRGAPRSWSDSGSPAATRAARHQVDAAHHLGHGVLDLQAGVHLQEVRRAICAAFPRALPAWYRNSTVPDVGVAARLGHPDPPPRPSARGPSSGRPGAGVSSMSFWCRRWAEQSALAERNGVAVGVGQDLDLHVAGPREVPLDVDLVLAEIRLRPPAGGLRAAGDSRTASPPPSCPARRRRRRP